MPCWPHLADKAADDAEAVLDKIAEMPDPREDANLDVAEILPSSYALLEVPPTRWKKQIAALVNRAVS